MRYKIILIHRQNMNNKISWLNEKHKPVNTSVLVSVEDIFTNRRKNGVISSTTAASIWGFSPVIAQKIDITFPISKVPEDIRNNKNWFNITQMVDDKYNLGIENIIWEEKNIRIYSPERTIVEIIKDNWTHLTDVVIETIKNFFNNIKYDSSKLFEYAEKFNVRNEVMFAQGMVRG